MRIKIVIIISLMVLFFCHCAVFAGGHCDPSSPPSMPENLPPLAEIIAGRASASSINASGEKFFSVTYDLNKGWNIISFPFSFVKSTKGFKYKLLRYGSGAYYAIDPNTEASQINTRNGYIAYSDAPARATATGVLDNREIRSMSLGCGWNLIGCPQNCPAPWNRMVAFINPSTQYALDVAGLPSKDNDYWISSRAYVYDNGIVSFDLTAPGAEMKPGQGLWLFLWHPLTLTGMKEKGQIKQIKLNRVIPSSVIAGQKAILEGSGFGNSKDGLFISGIPVTGDYILSWKPDRIVFRVPSYSSAGDIVVYVKRTPSNKIRLDIGEPENSPPKATLMGKVQDGYKSPIKGALVMLDNGLSSYTKADGSFTVERIPPGKHSLAVSLAGHWAANGNVELPSGDIKAVLITLVSYLKPEPPPEVNAQPKMTDREERIVSEVGTLYAVASSIYSGSKRWWVYRIDVTEWGNLNYAWHNIWYNDYGDTYYELKCPGARVGMTYNFKIEWRTKDGGKIYTNTWQRKMFKQYQKENFDNAW